MEDILALADREQWAQSQFAAADMGERRRTRRLVKLAAMMAGSVRRSDPSVISASLRFVWPYTDELAEQVIAKLNRIAAPQRYGPVAADYTGLSGRTPLLKLNSLAADCPATVLMKLECMEPNSVKDRPVYSFLEQAIRDGRITPQTEVIEASSGNVAFAISAILKVLLNMKPRIFISKMHGPTKARAVRVSGAPVMLTSAGAGTASAKRASVRYAEQQPNGVVCHGGAKVETHVGDDAGALLGLDHRDAVLDGVGNRLFEIDGFAGFQCFDGHIAVDEVRGGVDDGIKPIVAEQGVEVGGGVNALQFMSFDVPIEPVAVDITEAEQLARSMVWCS